MTQLMNANTNNSRLRLWWVISQRNALPLDFVEALLTEMIPVSKKAIFWWTAPSTQHSPSQATEPPITAGQGRDRSREHVINGNKYIQWCRFMGPQHCVWLVCVFCVRLFGFLCVWFVCSFVCLFFLQSKPSADNDRHEGEIKKKHMKKKQGLQDKNKNTEAGQDNTQQKAKVKHRLALNLSNRFTSSKWLKQIKQEYSTLACLYPLYFNNPCHIQQRVKMRKGKEQKDARTATLTCTSAQHFCWQINGRGTVLNLKCIHAERPQDSPPVERESWTSEA